MGTSSGAPTSDFDSVWQDVFNDESLRTFQVREPVPFQIAMWHESMLLLTQACYCTRTSPLLTSAYVFALRAGGLATDQHRGNRLVALGCGSDG